MHRAGLTHKLLTSAVSFSSAECSSYLATVQGNSHYQNQLNAVWSDGTAFICPLLPALTACHSHLTSNPYGAEALVSVGGVEGNDAQTVWSGNWACGASLTYKSASEPGHGRLGKEGGGDSSAVLKTEQFERKGGVGGDVSMLMLKCTGLNLSQMDVQAALTLACGSQSQRRPLSCRQGPRAPRLTEWHPFYSLPCVPPVCWRCLYSASKSNCVLTFPLVPVTAGSLTVPN